MPGDLLTPDGVQIQQTAESSSAFKSFLKDPTVPRKSRKETLDEVLAKMEASGMTKNFISKSPALHPNHLCWKSSLWSFNCCRMSEYWGSQADTIAERALPI